MAAACKASTGLGLESRGAAAGSSGRRPGGGWAGERDEVSPEGLLAPTDSRLAPGAVLAPSRLGAGGDELRACSPRTGATPGASAASCRPRPAGSAPFKRGVATISELLAGAGLLCAGGRGTGPAGFGPVVRPLRSGAPAAPRSRWEALAKRRW